MAIPFYGQNKDGDKLNYAAEGTVPIVNIAAGIHHLLEAKDSGSVVILAANSTEATLPAAAAGLNFTFIFSTHATAVCKVNVASGTDDFVGGLNANTGAGDDAVDGDTFITTGSATVAGDYVSVVSDGTDWFVLDSYSKVTTNGLAFGS